jgi:hypothetical protein
MLRHNAHVRTHVVPAVAKWVPSVAVTDDARRKRLAALALGVRNDLQLFSVSQKIEWKALTPWFFEFPLLNDWEELADAVVSQESLPSPF